MQLWWPDWTDLNQGVHGPDPGSLSIWVWQWRTVSRNGLVGWQ